MGTFYKKFLPLCVSIPVYVNILTGIAMGQSKTISIDKKNISLNEFLTEIRNQTGYDFVFTSSKVDFSKKVSPKFKDENIMSVLGQYFNSNTGVIFMLKNKTIVLIDEEKADYRMLQGKVINALNKQPMTGVTVSIDEKNIKTKTDSKGYFNINIPEYAKNLYFNFLGFEKKPSLLLRL